MTDSEPASNVTRVVVTEIRIPFWSMVGFMIEWAFAAIPAAFIIGLVSGVVMFIMRDILHVL